MISCSMLVSSRPSATCISRYHTLNYNGNGFASFPLQNHYYTLQPRSYVVSMKCLRFPEICCRSQGFKLELNSIRTLGPNSVSDFQHSPVLPYQLGRVRWNS